MMTADPEPESRGKEGEEGGQENQENKEAGGGTKGEQQLQVVQTEQEWERLVHTLGLVVVDIFSTWCGPCTAMDFHLKRLKMKSVLADDKVRADSDSVMFYSPSSLMTG